MIIILVLAIASIVVGFILIYNRLVNYRSLMAEASSGMDVQLKRRHDLIPRIVEVVKGYSQYEKSVLEGVTQARAQATGAVSVADKQEAEKNLSQALKSIFAVSEAYPNLKADQNFLGLQTSLSEIEDQIQMARRYYNGTVRNFNIQVQSFPSNCVAAMFHLTPASYFEIEYATERQNPDVRL